MTIEFIQDVKNVGGTNYANGDVVALDPQTEARFITSNLAKLASTTPYPVELQGTPRPAVTPTIAGVSTPVVAINGGAAAGSRHITDATPTAAEVLAEQVHWSFASTDVVKKVRVGLNVQPIYVTALSGTAGEVVKSPEVAHIRVTVMTSPEDVIGASRLVNGQPEVYYGYPGETLEIPSAVAITDVYAIAVLANGTVLQNVAAMDCMGVSYA